MIVAAKLLIVSVWVGAAFSKLGRHFANVIPPMVSNTPWVPSKAIKRLHYRSFPEDLRPSERAVGLAHVGGTLVEMGTPLVLLFSHNHAVTVVAVALMLAFSTFIISTFPLAVPLEWNALFMYTTVFLFLGYPNHDGFGLGDMDTATSTPSTPARTCRPAAAATPPRPSRRRSSASRPGSATGSSPVTCAAPRRWRPTTPTTSAATS